MELPAHSFQGKKPKNGNGKGGLPGWPCQNEDDYQGQEGHATQTCSFCDSPSTCSFHKL